MSTDKATACKQELAKSRMQLRHFLTSLTPEQWDTVVVGEGNDWTVRDVIAHLLENERGMSIHIHRIRKGGQTVPDGFDLEEWNAGLKERATTPEPVALMQALAQTRAKTLEVMDSLADDDWGKTGRHPSRGEISIEQYYYTIAGHDAVHTEDIKKGLGL